MTTKDSSSIGVSFGDHNNAYRMFRPTYSAMPVDAIMEPVASTRRALAIDLGCGTGLSTQPLLPLFKNVIAVEPDPRMAAAVPAAANLQVVVTKAEEFELGA